MWKKDESTQDQPVGVEARPQTSRSTNVAAPSSRGPATIGSSITIRGEVTGDEDLLIEGRVDGSVELKKHAVTVGAEGQVKAGISGRVVTVEGRVDGDLRAEEMVVLRSSAQVQGDITAPRVILEDGASFRGGVDMGDHHGGGTPAAGRDSGASAADRTSTDGTAAKRGKSASETSPAEGGS